MANAVIASTSRSLSRAVTTRIALQPLARSFSHQRTGAVARPSTAVCSRHFKRSFQTSVLRSGQGEADAELSQRLAEEIEYEKENGKREESEPEFLTAFKKANVWRIDDKAGSDEITLSREFGNEHIRILFSIGDIDTAVVPERDPEVENGEAEAEEDDSEDDTQNFPVRCAVTISKASHGALTIETQVQDGGFHIENISFFRDAALGTDLTAEGDWARRGMYIGPHFDTLDDGVQEQLVAYLTERGIDSDLASFIPTFAELKEQREYCSWLENVRGFVDA